MFSAAAKFMVGISSGASRLLGSILHVPASTVEYSAAPAPVPALSSPVLRLPAASSTLFAVKKAPAPAAPVSLKTKANLPAKTLIPAPVTKRVAAPVPAPALALAPTSPSPSIAAPTPAVPVAPTISLDALNTQVRAAIVNIMCTAGSSATLSPMSGSGVVVDSRGIILTNAHVAQFFLMRDYPTNGNVQCVIRTGSPARAMYNAELLYLSPAWVAQNAVQITSSAPTGSGEHDFAFLRITGTTNPAGTLPAWFPRLPMSSEDPLPNDRMLLAAYPASFLHGATILTDLYQTSAYATVGKVYIFKKEDQWVDLFSIPGSMVSQGGSSGGAAVRLTDGTLAGIIVTDTEATTTSGRDLRAVSLAHIDNTLQADGMGGITGLLSGDVKAKAAVFNKDTAPGLTKQLTDQVKI